MRPLIVSLCLFLLVTALVLRHAAAEPATQDQLATATAAARVTETASATPSAITFPSPSAQTPRATLPAYTPAEVVPSPTPSTSIRVVVTPTTPSNPSPVIVTDIVSTPEEVDPMPEAVVEESHVADAGETTEVQARPESTQLGDEWDAAIHTLDGGVVARIVTGQANVRLAPSLDAEVATQVYAGWPLTIYGAVQGDWTDGSDIWYVTWSGKYIAASVVQPFIAPTPEMTFDGNWVDVNLSQQYAIGYVGATPVYAAIVMTGQPGFETPIGVHTVMRRVASDTMDSATVGIPKGDSHYYYLTDVKYTQYFADGGFALHANYWSGEWEFGAPRSHGCVDMFEDDAGWFWAFLDIGSVVRVHE